MPGFIAGFLAAYRGARGDTLEQCVALLQKAGSEAVEALQQSACRLIPKVCD
jgi:hypothetical protein